MALKSLYCVECICGCYIESETNTLICPGCQRLVVIEWPGKEEVRRSTLTCGPPCCPSEIIVLQQAMNLMRSAFIEADRDISLRLVRGV